MKWVLLLAIVFGSSAFLLDAFFAHGLRAFLGANYSETAQNALTTASRYQLMAALFLLILILIFRSIPTVWVLISQGLTISGIICFCGTIYLKHLLSIPILSFLAPLGGISFILAFLALVPLMSLFS